jgi:16S rRNA (cytosine967-C5)-methyltransferase
MAQDQMLGHVGEVVAPGGRLVYATCSSEPDENEAVVYRFLQQNPAFRLAPAAWLPEGVRRFINSDGFFQTLPFRDQLEAFFAAMLVKTKDLR